MSDLQQGSTTTPSQVAAFLQPLRPSPRRSRHRQNMPAPDVVANSCPIITAEPGTFPRCQFRTPPNKMRTNVYIEWGIASTPRNLRASPVPGASTKIYAVHARHRSGPNPLVKIESLPPMATMPASPVRQRITGRLNPNRLLTLLNGRETQEVYLIETGKFDLYLAVETTIPCGTRVEFSVPTGFPVELKTITGIVHWSLSHRTSPEAGIALIAAAPPDLIIAAAGSLRKNLRYPCKIMGHVQVENGGVLTPATAINYSRNGMCLQSKEKFEIGVRLKFEWVTVNCGVNSGKRQTVTAEARWVSPVAGMFLVGCQTLGDELWPMSTHDVHHQIRSLQSYKKASQYREPLRPF